MKNSSMSVHLNSVFHCVFMQIFGLIWLTPQFLSNISFPEILQCKYLFRSHTFYSNIWHPCIFVKYLVRSPFILQMFFLISLHVSWLVWKFCKYLFAQKYSHEQTFFHHSCSYFSYFSQHLSNIYVNNQQSRLALSKTNSTVLLKQVCFSTSQQYSFSVSPNI